MKYNRIIFYGCSHTQGAELWDHIALEISADDCDSEKMKKGVEKFYETVMPADHNERRKHEIELSYANLIAKYLDLEYVNRAEVGISMQHMVYCIERDLLQGEILETDIVFVGITCQGRWFYLNDDGDLKRPMFSYGTHWPNEKIRKNFVNHFTSDNNLAYHWYNAIRHLNLLGNTEIKLFMQYVHWNATAYAKWHTSNLSADVISMLNSMQNFDTILDHNYSFTNIIDWNDYSQIHGFMHPRQHKHTEFADHIKYILEERINE